jgi:hypothetical protein
MVDWWCVASSEYHGSSLMAELPLELQGLGDKATDERFVTAADGNPDHDRYRIEYHGGLWVQVTDFSLLPEEGDARDEAARIALAAGCWDTLAILEHVY